MQGDDPPVLTVGTEVSAKYKGAFCEAKIKKVVKNIKCKVSLKDLTGSSLMVNDEAIKGTLRVGATVEVKTSDQKKELVEAIITKLQDCSQYTVVFDDGDITTLRRSALCLKSGRHFNESETLDQLPLTHPEHFSTPVISGRRGRRGLGNHTKLSNTISEDGGSGSVGTSCGRSSRGSVSREPHAGRVVLVEGSFPGLVLPPRRHHKITKDDYLVRSFKDGRYYTVPRSDTKELKKTSTISSDIVGATAAIQYLQSGVLPPHWDAELLQPLQSDDSSDDEPREEKDHFVAQLYKFMDDRGTPLNKNPTIANKDVDLYRLFRVVQKMGGYNKVTNQNLWRSVAERMGYNPTPTSNTNMFKQAYKKFLHSFEDFYRKLGVTLVAHPRGSHSSSSPASRPLIRDKDRAVSSTITVKKEEKEEEDVKPDKAVVKEKPAEKEKTVKEEKPAEKEKVVEKYKTVEKYKLVEKEKPVEKVKEKEKVKVKVEDEKEIDIQSSKDKEKKSKIASEVETSKRLAEQSLLREGRRNRRTQAAGERRPNASTDSDSSGRASRCAIQKKAEGRRSQSANSASSGNTISSNSSKKPRKRKNTETSIPEIIKVSGECSKASIGDRLKVYYGPNQSESKVTYEAKVTEINEDGTLLRVHYTGWNTRYDEWIKPQRIAFNLTREHAGRNTPGATRRPRLSRMLNDKSTATESDSDTDSEDDDKIALIKKGKMGRRSDKKTNPPNESENKGISDKEGEKLRATSKSRSKPPHTAPAGKDYDLNETKSELKGLRHVTTPPRQSPSQQLDEKNVSSKMTESLNIKHEIDTTSSSDMKAATGSSDKAIVAPVTKTSITSNIKTTTPITVKTTSTPSSIKATITSVKTATLPAKSTASSVSKPAAQSVNKPPGTPVSKSIATHVSKPITTSASKPIVTPVSKTIAPLVSKPAITPAGKPSSTLASKSPVTHVNKSIVATVSKPTATPDATPTIISDSKPTLTPVSKPILTPVSKPTLTPVSKPTLVSVSKPTALSTIKLTATTCIKPTTTALKPTLTSPIKSIVTSPMKPTATPTIKTVAPQTIKQTLTPIKSTLTTIKPILAPALKPVTTSPIKPIVLTPSVKTFSSSASMVTVSTKSDTIFSTKTTPSTLTASSTTTIFSKSLMTPASAPVASPAVVVEPIDDVYEFKEPEPFEVELHSEEKKKRPRLFESNVLKSPPQYWETLKTPPAIYMQHEGPKISEKLLEAISNANKIKVTSPVSDIKESPLDKEFDITKPGVKEEIISEPCNANKDEKEKIEEPKAITKLDRKKSVETSDTKKQEGTTTEKVEINLDTPIIKQDIDSDIDVKPTIKEVKTSDVISAKLSELAKVVGAPPLTLITPAKNNKVLSDTIEKLSNQIQKSPPATSNIPQIPLPTFLTHEKTDSSDSDDSEKRSIVEKPCQKKANTDAEPLVAPVRTSRSSSTTSTQSQTTSRNETEWSASESLLMLDDFGSNKQNTAPVMSIEEENEMALLLCSESIPGSPAPAQPNTTVLVTTTVVKNKPYLPFASSASSSAQHKEGSGSDWKCDEEWRHSPNANANNPTQSAQAKKRKSSERELSDLKDDFIDSPKEKILKEEKNTGGRRSRKSSECGDRASLRTKQRASELPLLKYNFYVQMQTSWDSRKRINTLLSTLSDLRSAYHNEKAQLAAIDRRRKKLRRKERENKAAKTAA